MFPIFFIHSSISGHLDAFHVLSIMNSAAMNIGVHVSFELKLFQLYTKEWNFWIMWQLFY